MADIFIATVKATTREEAESNLLLLEEKWQDKYAAAIHFWQKNWEELSDYFDYPKDIRRLIYTTNAVEAYHRQLRKVMKNKSSFPDYQDLRKLLYLATVNITKKWSVPLHNWPLILNQIPIRFEGSISKSIYATITSLSSSVRILLIQEKATGKLKRSNYSLLIGPPTISPPVSGTELKII